MKNMNRSNVSNVIGNTFRKDGNGPNSFDYSRQAYLRLNRRISSQHILSLSLSRLTAKLDPGFEPPRVQMQRFDPLPLISSRVLLITLRFEDYLALSESTDSIERILGVTSDH